MSESNRIESGEEAPSHMHTESEYQALLNENALLKQALDEQRAREREKTAESKITKDLGQLLATGQWSDVAIIVEGKIFAAHRAILSARSPIFADLLEQNHTVNYFVINDVPVGVFEVLLNFIYTGKVPSLEPQMARDLRAAADKYQLELTNSDASSISPFLHLPDLCLLALFRQLPPADQMSACRTCHRWSVLMPAATRRHPRFLALSFNCTEKFTEYQLTIPFNSIYHGYDWKLLKLLKKDDGSPYVSIRQLTKWNSLKFNSLDADTVSQITATFPAIKELQLCARTSSPDLLISLLEHWRHTLTSLNLNADISSLCKHLLPTLDQFTTAINNMSTLKHLTIDLFYKDEPFLPYWPLLSRSTQFNIHTDSGHSLDSSRQNLPLNAARTQISFGRYHHPDTIAQLASLSPDLSSRIVRFDYLPKFDYLTTCSHLHSLTSVVLQLTTEITLRTFFIFTSRLTQLALLKLSIDFTKIDPDEQPHHRLPQLKSVKLLCLCIIKSTQIHHDLQSLALFRTMPNVQVIDFEFYSLQCTTCGISNQSTPDEKKQGLRQIFAPLKRACTKLHTIKHDRENWLGTAEEILAEE